MYKAENNKLAEVFSGAKTVGKVAQNLRHLDKVIETYGDDVCVMMHGESYSNITSINGISVPTNEESGLVEYKAFREALELARAAGPDQIAVIHSDDGGDYYITEATVEVFNLDPNYPDGQLGCRVMLR